MLDGMTNIKASEVLKELKDYTEDLPHYSPDEVAEALEMATKALEQQPNRCDSCTHSEEQDGSNCYECIKNMADNFEAQPTDADCISREAVIRLVEQYPSIIGNRCSGLIADIKHLPSVTPRTNLAETSQDCIGREETKRFLYERIDRLNDDELYDIFSRIIDDMYNELPSVTPERPKGEWIHKMQIMSNPYTQQCSVCKEWQKDKTPYCPVCGAEMKEDSE